MVTFLYKAWLPMEINSRFLVNQHRELYFLLHDIGALVNFFMLKNLK